MVVATANASYAELMCACVFAVSYYAVRICNEPCSSCEGKTTDLICMVNGAIQNIVLGVQYSFLPRQFITPVKYFLMADDAT